MKFIAYLLLLSNLTFLGCGAAKGSKGPKEADEFAEESNKDGAKQKYQEYGFGMEDVKVKPTSDGNISVGGLLFVPTNHDKANPQENYSLEDCKESLEDLIGESIKFLKVEFFYENWFEFDIAGSDRIINAKFFPKIIPGNNTSHASVDAAVKSVEKDAWYTLNKTQNGNFSGLTDTIEECFEIKEIPSDETIEIIAVLEFDDGTILAEYLRFVVYIDTDSHYSGFRLILTNDPENQPKYTLFGVSKEVNFLQQEVEIYKEKSSQQNEILKNYSF